jgi:hypothetical protein
MEDFDEFVQRGRQPGASAREGDDVAAGGSQDGLAGVAAFKAKTKPAFIGE